MIHARSDYRQIQDPSGKIPADEPVFLIRAQDRVGPDIVDLWAQYAADVGAAPDIIIKAQKHAQKMRDWQREHGCKVPDLPPAITI
jgi:hypothetical protein